MNLKKNPRYDMLLWIFWGNYTFKKYTPVLIVGELYKNLCLMLYVYFMLLLYLFV